MISGEIQNKTTTEEEQIENAKKQFAEIIEKKKPFLMGWITDDPDGACVCGKPECKNGKFADMVLCGIRPSEIATVVMVIAQTDPKFPDLLMRELMFLKMKTSHAKQDKRKRPNAPSTDKRQ